MNGLGGLNKSPEGVVIGLVQLQLPVVVTPADLARQTEGIVYMVGKARRNLGTRIVTFDANRRRPPAARTLRRPRATPDA